MQILNLDPAALISEKNSKKWLQVLLETSATWEVFWIRTGIALNTDPDPDPALEVNTVAGSITIPRQSHELVEISVHDK